MFALKHAALAIILIIASVGSSCPAGLAQSTVLTGKINNDVVPRIIQQNAVIAPTPLYQSTVTRVMVPAPVQNSSVRYVQRPVTRPVYRTVYVRDNRTYFQRHPKVKAVAIGAGVGAGVGGVTGLISGAGFGRGALIGAGTGAGVGLVRSSHTMRRHPVVRNIATGGLVGLGLGGAASRRPRRALQGAGIGAAVGLGASLLQGQFN